MPKSFEPIVFDFSTFKKEITEYENFLMTKPDELSEQDDISPFFKSHQTLSSQIASLFSVEMPDRIVFEYDIFGDFRCDLAIGNSVKKEYCFVEFEDARTHSLFKNEDKFKPSFGLRLEHGHSQIIDWFYKIENLQGTKEMEERFNTREIDYYGVLIIGRNKFLDGTLRNRLDWRSDNIIINQKSINIVTFDDLLSVFKTKLSTIELYRK